MKPFYGIGQNPIPYSYYANKKINSNNKIHFTGATEEFSKRFIRTQKEIIDEFIKDPKSNWIVGDLPDSWLAKLTGKTQDERNKIVKQIFLLFRAAIKHLKPYDAPINSKEYSKLKANLENKRIKEASAFLTKGLRHFGILPEGNSVNLKKLKVNGLYIKRGYVLKEKGGNPTLERLFIKKFRKINPLSRECDTNGQYSEIVHGLYLNKNVPSEYITKFYWGDTKTGYMATKYETPPKHSSPIVKFKKEYNNLQEFANDFYDKTGIELSEVIDQDITPGKFVKNKFHPYSKETLILNFLQKILNQHRLQHNDLHDFNAIIGQTQDGKPIVKIIDIGGITQF